MNFYQSMIDPKLFGPQFAGDSWDTWRTVLRAASGMKLDESQMVIYSKVTGRQTIPKDLHELWMIIGRRGGKDVVSAFLTLFLACGRDWKKETRPGETVVGMVICPDRKQGRVALNYMRGFIETVPLLSKTVKEIQKEAIIFRNGLRVEIHTASFRSTRGYTIPFVILDELAFFRDENSAVPDTEILAALKPGMATVRDSLLIAISTPYARRGEVWKAHQKHYGKENDRILVVKGPTQLFNPTVPAEVIQAAFAEDSVAAMSEYGSLEEGIQFRSDVEAFVPREVAEACVVSGRFELPCIAGCQYQAFTDPSGGSQDSFTLAIGHNEKEKAILDVIREKRPPFSPESVTEEFSVLLKDYKISTVVGDRYGGQWPQEQFRKHGINYRVSEQVKSEIYLAALPLLNSRRVELLDNPRLITQLCNLERRTARSGKDSVDHGPGAHDDLINAAAGALGLVQQPVEHLDPRGCIVGRPRDPAMMPYRTNWRTVQF